MDPLRTYDYLTLARGKVFDWVRPLSAAQYLQKFPIGLGSLGCTLTHIMIAEWFYMQRMYERSVPPYEEWPIQYEKPPAFAVVETTWRAQAVDTRAAIAAERDWSRKISWRGFPDEQGRVFDITATAGDFVTQLVLHEVHHRAQIMAMLRVLGDARPGPPLEDLDYNALMFERRPATSA